MFVIFISYINILFFNYIHKSMNLYENPRSIYFTK